MKRAIFVISHRRSGTHWTLDAIRHNFDQINDRFLTLDQLYEPWIEDKMQLDEFDDSIRRSQSTTLIKTHYFPPYEEHIKTDKRVFEYVEDLLSQSPKIYVHRDGRDVMVSLYHYIRSFNDDLQDVSFSQFIRMQTECGNRVRYWREHVAYWLKQDVLPLSYEALADDYAGVIDKIGRHIGQRPNPQLKSVPLTTRERNLLNRIQRRLVRTLGRREIGASSAVYPRKGKKGDWKQYFRPDDRTFFNDHAGALMTELGYTT